MTLLCMEYLESTIMLSRSSQGESSVLRIRLRVIKANFSHKIDFTKGTQGTAECSAHQLTHHVPP